MQTNIKTVDQYLAAIKDKDQRAALARLRKQIKTIIPQAEERISYGMPGYRVDGRMVVYFGAAAKHCALYGPLISAHQQDLAGYDTSKGTLRFQPERPPPLALLRKLIKSRVAANADRSKQKPAAKTAKTSKRKRA
jgi:uncharacterized protein YdhG (YjbR/CyaY superfamily)